MVYNPGYVLHVFLKPLSKKKAGAVNHKLQICVAVLRYRLYETSYQAGLLDKSMGLSADMLNL